jgi:hypothetical protein
MTENTKLWDILGRTDPAHTKAFTRGGGFKGTAIKPMWSYRRMTEEFGPCGLGWGVGEPVFQVVPGSEGEILVYCTASVWYRHEEKDCRVYGVGGDKIVNKFSSGLKSDDEAFKKAFTDAVTNALKLIGVGADVHMGMFDDNKYVNTMKEEFSAAPPAQKPTRHALKKDIGNVAKPDRWDEFERELLECTNILQLNKLAMAWSAVADAQGWADGELGWRTVAKEEINKRRAAILNPPPVDDDDVFPGDRPSNGNSYVDNFIP